jgi:hypothetical protein
VLPFDNAVGARDIMQLVKSYIYIASCEPIKNGNVGRRSVALSEARKEESTKVASGLGTECVPFGPHDERESGLDEVQ